MLFLFKHVIKLFSFSLVVFSLKIKIKYFALVREGEKEWTKEKEKRIKMLL